VPHVNPGDRFGPYEIVSVIGSGGMGRVYKALDSRLSRFVALKILSAEARNDPDRLHRFEQEARAASALSHPNILTIYETGEIAGEFYIAMEFIEGQTLRHVLGGGALPNKKILDYAAQIAEGLSKAHAAGIVHRDLKPENLMVTPDGFVKILDFGLAKLIDPLVDESRSMSETISDSATRPGTLLGTVSYMSPEQARGEHTDFRSDFFSLGSVLYEMAAGRRAFRGRSSVDTLSQILNEAPKPLLELAPNAPVQFVWIVEKCLAKEPAERYQSTRDLAIDLKRLREEVGSAASISGVGRSPRLPQRITVSRRALAAGLVGAALLAAAAGYRVGRIANPPPAESLSSDLVRLTRDGALNRRPAIAPDGKSFVFESSRGGPPRIYLQYFSGGTATRVSHEEGDFAESYPAWSPDGAQIAYQIESAEGFRIALIPPVGGRPVVLLADARWPAWSPDGSRLYFVRPRGTTGPPKLMARPMPTGSEGLITALEDEDGPPAVSPDGTWIAFFRAGTEEERLSGICLVPSSGGQPHRAVPSRSITARTRVAWLPDSKRFVFPRDNGTDEGANLWIGNVGGHIEGRVTNAAAFFFNPALSHDGRLLLCDPYDEQEALWRVPLTGSPDQNVRSAERLTFGRATETDPALSPDERKIVFTSNREGTTKLWILDLASHETHPLEFGPLNSYLGSFSPSGQKIAFYSKRTGHPALWLISADGTGGKLVENTLQYPDPPSSEASAAPLWISEEEIAAEAETGQGGTGLFRVPLGQGRPELVERDIRKPIRSPTGEIAFVAGAGSANPVVRVRGQGATQNLFPASRIFADLSRLDWAFTAEGSSFLVLRTPPDEAYSVISDLFEARRPDGNMRRITQFSRDGMAYQFCVSRDGHTIVGARVAVFADIVSIKLSSESERR
jgi:serine/threonine protein kinase